MSGSHWYYAAAAVGAMVYFTSVNNRRNVAEWNRILEEEEMQRKEKQFQQSQTQNTDKKNPAVAKPQQSEPVKERPGV
jgi:hypothetical protein